MEAYHLSRRNYDDSNLSGIQEYLETGGDANFQYYHGTTVFMEAVCYPSDNIDVIRELINAGADVYLSNHMGGTPLHMAVAYRKRRVVEKLIQSGASVNAKDILGRSVLHVAVRESALCLPETPVQLTPDMRIINELLKREDIDCNQVDFYGETPLMWAVFSKHIEITSLLLRNNANPNIGNTFLETPLHMAFYLPGKYPATALLDSGASIYYVDKSGRTPLDVLLENGLDIRNNEIVICILKTIALKCSITSDVRRKFQRIPHLSQVFNQCCEEADRMRGDFIYGNITMHDFIWGCFLEEIPDIHDIHLQKIYMLHIHIAVVERLVRDIYPKFVFDIEHRIPTSSLQQTLQIVAERKCLVNDLALLFSNPIINDLICMYISRDEILVLIRVFSGVTISE